MEEDDCFQTPARERVRGEEDTLKEWRVAGVLWREVDMGLRGPFGILHLLGMREGKVRF